MVETFRMSARNRGSGTRNRRSGSGDQEQGDNHPIHPHHESFCKWTLCGMQAMVNGHCTSHYRGHCITFKIRTQKSRIRETKHLSTDADSSTDAKGGWIKNTPKLDSLKTQKLRNV